MEAADALAAQGVNAEVINMRCIRPLDRDTLLASVTKTHRLVTVEEGWPQSGVGAEMAACVFESAAFDYLDAPVERITGADVPMPYAINLETLAKPQAQNIVNAALRAVNRQM